LESKKDMKARGLASPDAADAIALTFSYPVASRGEYNKLDNRSTKAYASSHVGTSWMGS
jgi:phage terminase large subunit